MRPDLNSYQDSQTASDDAVSINSQGIEVQNLSDDGVTGEVNPTLRGLRKKKPAPKRAMKKLQDPNKDKATVDPCKYKTKLCRSWMRDGFCSYESVCSFAHGESDLRTVHQNTQVLSSLGYFSELMLLAIENEGKPGQSQVAPQFPVANMKAGKRGSKGDTKAAQVEASLVHFARTSAVQGNRGFTRQPNAQLDRALGNAMAASPPTLTIPQEPVPTMPQPTIPQPQAQAMVHAPYATPGKLSFVQQPAIVPFAVTREQLYEPYGVYRRMPTPQMPMAMAINPYVPQMPFVAPVKAPATYGDYTLLPASQQAQYAAMENEQEPPWKHPPQLPQPVNGQYVNFNGDQMQDMAGHQYPGTRLRGQ